MLFTVNQKPVRKENPEIDSIPEFSALTDREMKYICLMYDYDTPFRQHSLKDRSEMAAEVAGYKRESVKRLDKSGRNIMNGKMPKVEAAIPVFRRMLRDIDKETLIAFDNQLQQFIDKTSEVKENNKDWEVAMKIITALPKLLSMRKEIIETLGIRAEDIDEGKEIEREMSTLDKINEKKIREGL